MSGITKVSKSVLGDNIVSLSSLDATGAAVGKVLAVGIDNTLQFEDKLVTEDVEDIVAALILRGNHTNLSVSYIDGTNQLNLAVSGLATVSTSGSYNDLTDTPTNVSVFINDAGYLTINDGYATETYVDTEISNLVASAPATLDTLNELAAALGDDPNFATTIATNISTKVSKSGDTMTGDLTVPNIIVSGNVDGRDVSVDGTKLDGIEASANNYVHPAAHTISEVTGLQTALDGKVDDSQVLTDVPAGAVFTDTTYSNLNEFTNGPGYITDYTVTEGDVTAHEAALTITQSQISDFSSSGLPTTGGTMTGTLVTKGVTETWLDYSYATLTVNPEDYTLIKWSFGWAITPYFAESWPDGATVKFMLKAGTSGSVTWPNGIIWANGGAPVLSDLGWTKCAITRLHGIYYGHSVEDLYDTPTPTHMTLSIVEEAGSAIIPWTEFWAEFALSDGGYYGAESGATLTEYEAYLLADGRSQALIDGKIADFFSYAASNSYTLSYSTSAVQDTVTIDAWQSVHPETTINWGDGNTSVVGDFTGTSITHTYTGASGNDVFEVYVTSPNEWKITTGSTLVMKEWGNTPWYTGINLPQLALAMDSWSVTNIPTFKNNRDNLQSVTFTAGASYPGAWENGPSNMGSWDVSNVTSFAYAFLNSPTFNQDLSGWDVGNSIDFNDMFHGCNAFNQDISSWDVSKGKSFYGMFHSCDAFNQNISSWDMSSATNLGYMFWSANAFNQPLNAWDTSNVTSLHNTFGEATAFNQPLNLWNTSNVTNMQQTFNANNGVFNQDISGWDTSKVTTMRSMFQGNIAFNQPLNSWDVSSVEKFYGMFRGYNSSTSTAFNQPLNSWDTSSATDMQRMFQDNFVFDQNIRMWDVGNVLYFNSMFNNATAMIANQGAPVTPDATYFNQ